MNRNKIMKIAGLLLVVTALVGGSSALLGDSNDSIFIQSALADASEYQDDNTELGGYSLYETEDTVDTDAFISIGTGDYDKSIELSSPRVVEAITVPTYLNKTYANDIEEAINYTNIYIKVTKDDETVYEADTEDLNDEIYVEDSNELSDEYYMRYQFDDPDFDLESGTYEFEVEYQAFVS